jgi:hypothetical protein
MIMNRHIFKVLDHLSLDIIYEGVGGPSNDMLIQKESVTSVGERTTPTEQLPLVGEVNAKFYG